MRSTTSTACHSARCVNHLFILQLIHHCYQANEYLVQYGKDVVNFLPEKTTQLLLRLCDGGFSGMCINATLPRDSIEQTRVSERILKPSYRYLPISARTCCNSSKRLLLLVALVVAIVAYVTLETPRQRHGCVRHATRTLSAVRGRRCK